jgi:prophage tail gpP-like protein
VQIADEAFPTGDTRRFQCGQWVNLTNDVLGITSKGFLIHRVTTTILGGELKGYELELRDWFTEAA